jgi:lipopolysaccharide/colanic/teichoic acid biosynthesis glycosyltransferase
MRYKELADKNLRTDGPLVKIKDDPRVTRVGKIIRRWSIDELSELFLVFIGRMSLVGPRPHLPEEVAKYEQHHRKTLTIKPGITGLAQISGRSDLAFEEEVKLDIYYIENWSILLDFSILLRTPLAVLKHRQAE